MFKPIKKAVSTLPGFNRIIAERDRLRSKLNEVAAHRDNLLAERKKLYSERDGLYSEQEELNAKLDIVGKERDSLQSHLKSANLRILGLTENLGFIAPGHFYSPIPSISDIEKDEERIFGSIPDKIAGIELDEAGQLELLKEFVSYYREMPFSPEPQEGLRYYYDNPAYSYSDAIMLHCMIRHLQPRRIIEVGSGFSSCMMLDTNELFFDGSIATTFIEPHPELLTSLLKETDRGAIKTIPARLQDIGVGLFDALQANDILFIDSTHVSKIDSDVNRIVFDILPRLAAGVYVHFHDIFFPFEYPKSWVLEGRAWNEAYLLRAFLQFNGSFRTVLMNTYMEHFHQAFLEENMPLCLEPSGGSLWIRKE